MSIDSKKVNFPTWVLDDCGSALCLFCAAFGGMNDVQYVWDAGIERVDLVDNDAVKMEALWEKFDRNKWHFEICDCFNEVGFRRWLEDISIGDHRCDVTIADPWTDQVDAVLDMLDDLKAITRKYIVLTVTDKQFDRLPDDVTLVRRNNNEVYWAVFSL
jgi:hypothetical protein